MKVLLLTQIHHNQDLRYRERWYQMLYSLHLIFPFVWGNVIRIGDHHPVALCSTVVLLIKTATMEQLPPDSLCPRQALSKDWIFHGAPRQRHYCRTALTSLPKALVARLVWKKKRGRKHQLFDTFDISLSAWCALRDMLQNYDFSGRFFDTLKLYSPLPLPEKTLIDERKICTIIWWWTLDKIVFRLLYKCENIKKLNLNPKLSQNAEAI